MAARYRSAAWGWCSRSLVRTREGRSRWWSIRSNQVDSCFLTSTSTRTYSYILEGTIGARVGDHEIVAGPGSYVIKPRGLMHTFWNAGPSPTRLLEVISPAGFETYFIELAEAGDPGRRQELATKYGVTYSSDWVAELMSRYNLRLLAS